MDKDGADYTGQRVAAQAENNAAVDPLKFAMNRLNKFYNPKLGS